MITFEKMRIIFDNFTVIFGSATPEEWAEATVEVPFKVPAKVLKAIDEYAGDVLPPDALLEAMGVVIGHLVVVGLYIELRRTADERKGNV